MSELSGISGELKVAKLEMTCGAFPSQWEGELVDGRAIYIRYRWGELVIAIAQTYQEALDVFCGFSNDGMIFSKASGGDFDGECTLADVAALMPQVDFSEVGA